MSASGDGTNKRLGLPQVAPAAVGLGRPTIMDRNLAAQYGVPYVHLSVFAIDVDRVFMETEEQAPYPFGWEVMLCLGYLLGEFDTKEEQARSLLEDACTHVLSFAPGEAPLGSQLTFAVYVGARLGVFDPALLAVFHQWKRRPKQLEAAGAAFLEHPTSTLVKYALHCLGTTMSPPLAPPTLIALQAMVDGSRPLRLAPPLSAEDK